MGTPDFAVPSLQILHEAGYEIVGVVTAPDRPSGRGQKLRPSPVKVYAESHQLPLFQPLKLRDPEFVQAISDLQADLAVVVAFRMLPEMIWSLPKLGTFNLHSSLLPDYRGAAPINWVLMNGETRTGVTTFMIDRKIDTGEILLAEEVEIPDAWTAGELHDHLMEKGAGLVLKTAQGLQAGKLQPAAQNDALSLNPAPKIFKEDCRIDWGLSVEKIYHFVRGLSPYPTAWTQLAGKVMKIYRAQRESRGETGEPGQLIVDASKGYLAVATADGWLRIEELQLQGKRRMGVGDFLRGYKEELLRFE